MSFWKQLREATRLEIEDFFNVKWQGVALVLVVVAALILEAYLEIVDDTMAFFWWRMALLLVVLALVRAGRHFF